MVIINRIRKVLNLMKVGISCRLIYLFFVLLLDFFFFFIQEINPTRQLVRLVRVEQEA